eukprot:GHVN01017627.1.p1 GENE.GHVN01017627.1~~GHVN01017627.1.p1  ORF type:complete len:268 (+),score=19.87 GHVN01017627.1:40-843(+)
MMMRWKGRVWFNTDPCGLCGVFTTYFLLAFSDLVACFLLAWPGSTGTRLLHIIIYNVLVMLSVASHLVCMLSNPGTLASVMDASEIELSTTSTPTTLRELVNQTNTTTERSRPCRKCNALKPPRTHHCSTCGRCIFKMDHHCMWVNNCVAALTQKHFLLFLLYVTLLSGYSLGFVTYRVVSCMSINAWRGTSVQRAQRGLAFSNSSPALATRFMCVPSTLEVVLGFLLVIEAFIFGLFTISMLTDQVSSILWDESRMSPQAIWLCYH